MSTRIIGIDLGVTTKHKAAILDPASGRFVVKGMAIGSLPADLDHLLERAKANAGDDPQIIVVLEATSMAWHPLGVYLTNQGANVFRVNGRKTKAMRRLRHPHTHSDSVDCQSLAALYTSCRDRLDPLYLPSGAQLALQRACRDYVRYRQASSAIQNRLQAYDNYAWAGFNHLVPPEALDWVRSHWYNPWEVVVAGVEQLRTAWRQAIRDPHNEAAWIQPWVTRAEDLSKLLGSPEAIDYPALRESIQRNLDEKAQVEQARKTLYKAVILPLYRSLYPNCPLPSIYGVGEASAAIYMAFIHAIERFPNVEHFRQWSGMVPTSSQSGEAQVKGLPISQAGPNCIKATLYVDADVARQWDPQLAQVYYTQMVTYGKHHTQAICAVASHLASRIYTVLKQNRPYQLCDPNGLPITPTEAKHMIQTHFKVPEQVRRRTTKRRRRNPGLAPTP